MREIPAAVRIQHQLDVCSIYGFLDWSGDNWPQPHAVLGGPMWDWDALAELP